MEYVNRKENRYFLYQGTTKTGKPRYFCSRKSSAGEPVESMPEGYEWRENPENGTVTVRKVLPSRIIAAEREMLSEGIRNLAGIMAFIVDVTEDSLVAYVSDMKQDELTRLFELMGRGGDQKGFMEDWTAKNVNYSPMMRFVLANEDERLFVVERWCYLGRIDNWILLKGPAPLPELIDEYARHLGHESFFELG